MGQAIVDTVKIAAYLYANGPHSGVGKYPMSSPAAIRIVITTRWPYSGVMADL